MSQPQIAIATSGKTPIGQIYISPGGDAFATWRIGEMRNGVCISDPLLTDDEIERAGLTGKVNKSRNSVGKRYGEA